ncbi:MAG: adenosylmethionine decarboxylase [Candidatus Aramenus sulfurataquae]|jgi:S-adenosylmethionine decarboxylase|uniref:S-adenosylmethionine decarboxylase proenzyme n=3 Tax=Candidatus Aramenus sulfurataquae TaxID=1326980 RepID=A0A0F2LQN5_9CREN|nr:adenosylmethionine decarboxylase [Candidatus Aramenus sp.]MCL7343130.1 adenosylmethionine decarboxylase [Candidatus Aramenus sulfurataquae]
MMGVRLNYSPKVVGKQVYGSLYDCDEEVLKDTERLKTIVTNAAKEGNMTLLDIRSWKIGEGVSVVAIVLESHITIHTWPEYKFATVDVYSCGAHTDPKRAFEYIVSELKAKRYTMKEADRSSEF